MKCTVQRTAGGGETSNYRDKGYSNSRAKRTSKRSFRCPRSSTLLHFIRLRAVQSSHRFPRYLSLLSIGFAFVSRLLIPVTINRITKQKKRGDEQKKETFARNQQKRATLAASAAKLCHRHRSVRLERHTESTFSRLMLAI